MGYDVKVAYCGDVIEIYEYKEKIFEGYKNKIEKEKREQTAKVKIENYHRSIKRTKETIRQIVNTNFSQNNSSFLTLTFKDNVTDYDVAFSYWKRFKQKVERKFSIKLAYLGVVEFQERGAIHFHICLFNVPYLKHAILYDLWTSTCGAGGVYIEKIGANDCDNVGAYITKYMSKDMDDFFDNEYKGKKRYFKSRGLKEPFVQKFNTKDLPKDKEYFNLILNSVKDNIVYEYTSKEFEIKRKAKQEYEQEPVIIEYYEQDLQGNEKLIKKSFDGFRRKKIDSSELVTIETQQLNYKQINLVRKK